MTKGGRTKQFEGWVVDKVSGLARGFGIYRVPETFKARTDAKIGQGKGTESGRGTWNVWRGQLLKEGR
jgi:hypothetical protein